MNFARDIKQCNFRPPKYVNTATVYILGKDRALMFIN